MSGWRNRRVRGNKIKIMRLFRYISWVLLLAGSAFASPDSLLERLEPRGFVNDYANVISASDELQLFSAISELRQKTGVEIAVVTIQSLEGGDIDDFTNRLFEKWGIGQKGADNGLMFLCAMKDRKMRIEVGYGLEGTILDSKAGRIRRDIITPYFKSGNPSQGIVAGVAALSREIMGEPQPAPGGRRPPATPGQTGSMVARIAVLFGMLTIVATVARLGGAIRGEKRGKRGSTSAKDYFHGGGYHGGSGGGFGGGGYGSGFGGGCSGGGGSSGGW